MEGSSRRSSCRLWSLLLNAHPPRGSLRPQSAPHYASSSSIYQARIGSCHCPGSPLLIEAGASLPVADRVEVILRAKDQAIANEGRRGQGHFTEIVGIEQVEFIAGAD